MGSVCRFRSVEVWWCTKRKKRGFAWCFWVMFVFLAIFLVYFLVIFSLFFELVYTGYIKLYSILICVWLWRFFELELLS